MAKEPRHNEEAILADYTVFSEAIQSTACRCMRSCLAVLARKINRSIETSTTPEGLSKLRHVVFVFSVHDIDILLSLLPYART